MTLITGDMETQGTGSLQVDATNIVGNVTNAGSMTIHATSLTGDIVNNGVMIVDIGDHQGTITNNGIINGIINGVRYGNWRKRDELEELVTGDDFTDQLPVGLDTPLQISFGAAQSNSEIDLSAAGAITVLNDGQYEFSFTFQYGRTGAGGVSWLFFRLLKNGSQIGISPLAKLDNANADFPAEFNNTLNLLANDVITLEVIRDSRGNNSGGLLAETGPAGWTDTPSASISVKRSKLQ